MTFHFIPVNVKNNKYTCTSNYTLHCQKSSKNTSKIMHFLHFQNYISMYAFPFTCMGSFL